MNDAAGGTDRRLLVIEDDTVLARTLARSFERRGYRVETIGAPEDLTAAARTFDPTHAVVDLRLGAGKSGLACVHELHASHPDTRIVVLTGFASIATAVEAIKLGATNYLTKPSNTDEIEAAFERDGGDHDSAIATQPISAKTREWEHIQQTLVETDFNISEAARRLGLHRRTLARKLEKRRP